MSDCESPNLTELPKILTDGSAYTFVEEAERRQPWPVDISISGCVNVRKELQRWLRRKEGGKGCLTAREVAERRV